MDERIVKILQLLHKKEESLRGIATAEALNEAEAAAEKIAELCLKYKVDMTTVEREQFEASEPITREIYQYGEKDTYRAKKRVAWEVSLANSVARAHQCRLLVGHGYLVFVGRESDRAVATSMFRLLRANLTDAVTRGYYEARKLGHETRGYITTFMTAATDRIAFRYREMTTRVVAETNSTALVRQIDADLDAAVNAISTAVIRTSPKSNGHNDAGYSDGRAFGSSVSLNPHALDSTGRPSRSLPSG